MHVAIDLQFPHVTIGGKILEMTDHERIVMSKVPADLRYIGTHQWVRLEGDIATVGITDFAQEQLGDVVYAELPEVGAALVAAEEAGAVESVKSASEVYSPVDGEVVEVNGTLEDSPELLNESPYDDGWMFKVRLADGSLPDDLLTADQYLSLLTEH